MSVSRVRGEMLGTVTFPDSLITSLASLSSTFFFSPKIRVESKTYIGYNIISYLIVEAN